MPPRSPRNLLKQDMLSQMAKVRGANIGLQQTKKMNSSVCTDLVNMQNGISESTIATRRIRRADTNFRTAISKMFIGADCLRQNPELANMAIPKSKTRRQNWNAG